MKRLPTRTALLSSLGAVIAMLSIHFVPERLLPTIMAVLALGVATVIGGILTFRPERLLSVLEPLGFTDLDMNVRFKPPQPFLRLPWFVTSVAVLVMQFSIAVVISPLVLLWRVAAAILQRRWRDATAVPRPAQFLLLLAPKSYRENLIGDLEEEFYTIVLPQYGYRLARLWYWEQVACSLWPIFWDLLKRAAGLTFLWRITK